MIAPLVHVGKYLQPLFIVKDWRFQHLKHAVLGRNPDHPVLAAARDLQINMQKVGGWIDLA
jgi:hypothetical protein